MKKLSPNMIFLILLLVVALPEATALMLYKYTGDPTFRPLGLANKTTVSGDAPQKMLEILVRINIGADIPEPVTQDYIQQRLTKALDIYNIDFRLKFQSVAGNKVNVTYIVRHNKFGPYRLANASAGIPAALAALRAMQRP